MAALDVLSSPLTPLPLTPVPLKLTPVSLARHLFPESPTPAGGEAALLAARRTFPRLSSPDYVTKGRELTGKAPAHKTRSSPTPYERNASPAKDQIGLKVGVSANSVRTTFTLPRLEKDVRDTAWSELHFNLQQFFVFNGISVKDISHTPKAKKSRLHILTPKSSVGEFEETVKDICKQALFLDIRYAIPMERT